MSHEATMFEIKDVNANGTSTSTTVYGTRLSILPVRHPRPVARSETHTPNAVHRAIYEQQEYPEALRPFAPELRAFSEHNHFKVLHPLLQYVFVYSWNPWKAYLYAFRILARGMELPEDTFVNMHNFDALGETRGRPPLVYISIHI